MSDLRLFKMIMEENGELKERIGKLEAELEDVIAVTILIDEVGRK